MAPKDEGQLEVLKNLGYGYDPGEGRSQAEQAGYQMAALVVTLAMAIAGGTLTGIILRLPFLDSRWSDDFFEDAETWNVAPGQPEVEEVAEG